MGKKTIKQITVGDTTWTYAIDSKEVRIYKPGTKQILKRVPHDDFEKRDGVSGISPNMVADYISKMK